MIIADTSGLLAYFNHAEPRHAAVASIVESTQEPLVVSPPVVAELDYLVATRHGVEAELAVLEELAGGAWMLATFDAEDLSAARSVVERYRDQQIGIADASLVVLAERLNTRRILTLDHRHFDVVRPRRGGRFSLLPRS
ncbi:type II toxin-antitoxin system toxin ribonuclease C26 [soil metagenome]